MSILLCVKAHPLDERKSASLAAAGAFLASYRETHPRDEVLELDLYRTRIPLLDEDVFDGWEKLKAGSSFDLLSAEAQRKIARLGELVDQFLAADKLLFVTPMWNFSYPPLMKAYIDAITVAGKTFHYTNEGPAGLVRGKKALHIQTRGGVYSGTPYGAMESGHYHLERVLKFLGIPELEGLFIEGLNQFPDRAEAIKQEAYAKARDLARTF